MNKDVNQVNKEILEYLKSVLSVEQELAPKQKEFPVVLKVTEQYEQYIGTLDDLKKHLKEK